jgi:hypothetical protein
MTSVTTDQRRRLHKIYVERFFVLHVECDGAWNDAVVKLSGSAQTVYTLTVSSNGALRCDCPDSEGRCRYNGCLCKHICFLLVRVSKLAIDHTSDHIFFERRLCGLRLAAARSRLEGIAAGHARLDSDLVDTNLTGKYESIVSGGEDALDCFAAAPLKTGEDGETECSICYDTLAKGERNQCPECHNQIHRECIKRWLQLHNTCPLCRSVRWTEFHGTPRTSGQYLQL